MGRFFRQFNPRSVQVANFLILAAPPAPPDISSKTLAYAGDISRQWNHHTIIKALERLLDVRYRLCGPADEDYLRELKVFPAWERVEYLGKIPHEEIPALHAKSAFGMEVLSYLYNTDWENGQMGNTKIFEEMVAGLPVVCTDCNHALVSTLNKGTDAILLPTEWGEFNALDFEELARHVRKRVFFDFRNVYQKAPVEKAGFEYHGTGVGRWNGGLPVETEFRTAFQVKGMRK